MVELIGSGSMSSAHWLAPEASAEHTGVGAAPDGQVKPRPKRREPSLSSLVKVASNMRCGVIHFSPPTVVRWRLSLKSKIDPVPGSGSRLTRGVVVPAPCMLVLALRG